jgi:hypothetical protein
MLSMTIHQPYQWENLKELGEGFSQWWQSSWFYGRIVGSKSKSFFLLNWKKKTF